MSVIIRFAGLLLLSAAVIGCAETQRPTASGKGNVRALNALVDAPDVTFLIEERNIGTLPYKNSTGGNRFDDLSYTFNFDATIPGNPRPKRIASRLVDVVKDTDYMLVLNGTFAAPEVLVWEHPEREWLESETVFEVGFGNVHAEFFDLHGEIDVYFAEPGTMPVAGNAIGSLGFGERLDEREFPQGTYELILTPKDIPGTILYSGVPTLFSAAATYLLVILDTDPSLTGPASVRQIGPSGLDNEIEDSRFPPTAQFVHAAFGTGNVDVVIDDDFLNPPSVIDLGFGQISSDVDVPADNPPFAIVSTGNTAPILAGNLGTPNGLRSILILLGEPANPGLTALISNRRPLATSGRVRFTSAAFNAALVDLYFYKKDSIIGDILPTTRGLPFALSSGYTVFPAEEYELTVTLNGDKTPIAGPVPINLANGDVVEVLIIDTADPAIADVMVWRYPQDDA